MTCPISIKGVLIRDGCVLLLLNKRGEWDLPGGRPDPREDHRAALDDHLFEVLPGRFVRILPFACRLLSGNGVVLSHEHLRAHWLPVAMLGENITSHRLPACYFEAIRQVIDQPRSSNTRVV